jgi:hypothetical protein
MPCSRRALWMAVVSLVLACSAGGASRAHQEGGDGSPSVSLTVRPHFGFTPMRVRVLVQIHGGPNDYRDYYCPTVEWTWGDGTVSERSGDCPPYEAGRSEIHRYYTSEHVYRQPGNHQIVFRLKQGSRVVARTTANVQVRPSGRPDDFNF